MILILMVVVATMISCRGLTDDFGIARFWQRYAAKAQETGLFAGFGGQIISPNGEAWRDLYRAEWREESAGFCACGDSGEQNCIVPTCACARGSGV